MFVSPVPLNESVFELSVLPVSGTKLSTSVSDNAPDLELSVSPVSVNEPDYKLSARETIEELFVFSASSLETINALPVLSVSVLLRSRSLPWFPPQVWWSSAPPWWSSGQGWWSSAPPWWAPVLSAPPWWGSALSALSWPLAPPWLPALSVSLCFSALSPVSPLPHGPCPPSLPLFRLRSTALLDFIKVGASGSRSLGGGAMSRIPAMHFCSLTTRGHSLTTLTHTLHYTTGTSHWTAFPIIHCTDNTQLISLITLSHTLYKP